MKPSGILFFLALLLVIAVVPLSFFSPSIVKGKEPVHVAAVDSTGLHPMAIQTITLGNGLQVVVIPDPNGRETLHMVWYRVGSLDDPPGKTGLAHLVEHLTFGGTKNIPAPQFDRILEKTKKQDAITAHDYTVYYQIAAPEHLPTLMALEADRMSNVIFSEASMALESKALLDERQHTDWRAAFEQRIDEMIYGNHPYANSESTRGRELESLSEAVAFYRQWYAPNNAIVLVLGNVKAEQVMQLAQQHYAGITQRPIPERRIPDVDVPTGSRSVSMKDSRAQESIWRRSYLAPSYVAGTTEHVYALQVLGSLLTSGPGSRLHERLVREKALAKEVSVRYEPDNLSFSTFSIYVVLNSGTTFREVTKEVELEIRQLMTIMPSPHEVVRAQRNTQSQTDLQGEDIPGIAQLVGGALARGRTLEDVSAWPNTIFAVTPKQIQEAVKAILTPDRSVTGMVSP